MKAGEIMAKTEKSNHTSSPEGTPTKMAVVVRDRKRDCCIPAELLRRMLEHTRTVLRCGRQMAAENHGEREHNAVHTTGAASRELQLLVERYGLPALPPPSLPVDFWQAQLESYIDARLRELPETTEVELIAADRVQGANASDTQSNQVPYDEADLAFYPNKNALEDARTAGQEHEVDELRDLDLQKLKKLLRRRGGAIKYMSQRKPPRGRVHKGDWTAYINLRVTIKQQADELSEQTLRGLR
jgi:hypothetical protein